MKRLWLALALSLFASGAWAQCSGNFPTNTICGNAASARPPKAVAASTFLPAILPSPTRAGDIVYWNGTTWVTLAGNNSGTAWLQETSAGVPSWFGGAAITKVDDTNVTLTLGGSPTTAALAATSLTLGWTGQLAITRGGTGASSQSAAATAILPTPTRAGDVVYWNGSAWATLAGNNSGNAFLQENSSGVPSWATAGAVTSVAIAAGSGISVSGTCTITTSGTCTVAQSLTNATLQTSPTNLTGTTSATAVMMGYGATCTLTPVYSTRVRVNIAGYIISSALTTMRVRLKYGTGTAPSNGAADTGTGIGSTAGGTLGGANYEIPFNVGGIITGLTPSTAYWFDANMLSTAGATVTPTSISCFAMEF